MNTATWIAACILLVALLGVSGSLAVFGGQPAGPAFAFQGAILTPDTDGTRGCVTTNIAWWACGGALVDLPGFPARRVVLTAGHCVLKYGEDLGRPFKVTFGNRPGFVFDSTCLNPRAIVDLNSSAIDSPYFDARKENVWSAYTANINSFGMIGAAKDDFALVLLDCPVPASVVPVPARVASMQEIVSVPSLPRVGTAGYGTLGWGSRGDLLGTPININGPREKSYVEIATQVVTGTSITGQMRVARDEPTLCNGDSGSAALNATQVAAGSGPLPYTIYGVVSSGDANCRAINTWTRVGNSLFYDWLESVRDDINLAAAMHTCPQ